MGANAQTKVPTFASAEVLTAANQNLLSNGIPVFSGTATRNDAFGGSGEKVLAEGQFAYLEDSNTTQYYDGAAWQSVGVTPGLVYITGASFSAATTVSMASGVFTSTYKTYQVILQITASGSDQQLLLRVNNAGTPRTGSLYSGGSLRAASSSASDVTGSNLATSLNMAAITSTNDFMGKFNITVYDPTNAATKTTVSADGFGASNGNQASAILLGGVYGTAEANDGLTFHVGGNITGFYRVYGLSES
jgi:hypothetical protein